jgi:hypothetical protein
VTVTVVSMKMMIIRGVMSCSLVDGARISEKRSVFSHFGRRVAVILTMEIAGAFETLAAVYRTTCRHVIGLRSIYS